MIRKIFVLFFLIGLAPAFAVTPSYGPVHTEEERRANSDYEPFPKFQKIEIIRDGDVKQNLLNLLDRSKWDKDIEVPDVKWLQLRSFDLIPSMISKIVDSENIIIPFVLGIRYQEDGFDGIFVQGTVNVMGNILLAIEKGEVVGIEIGKFDDSSGMERFGRKIGFIDKYDGNFVVGVVGPVLKNYLTQPEHLKILMGFVMSETRVP